MSERTDWPDARIGALAQDVRELRKESGEQHRRLEQKVSDLDETFDMKMAELTKSTAADNAAVIKSIQADKDNRAAKMRWYLLSGALPVLLVLLGKVLAA